MEDIKKNAINVDNVNNEQEYGKRKHTEDDAANTNDQDQNVEKNENTNKFLKTGKKDRKRGQNKVSSNPHL